MAASMAAVGVVTTSPRGGAGGLDEWVERGGEGREDGLRKSKAAGPGLCQALGLGFASGCESLVPLVSVAAEAVAAAVVMLAR